MSSAPPSAEKTKQVLVLGGGLAVCSAALRLDMTIDEF